MSEYTEAKSRTEYLSVPLTGRKRLTTALSVTASKEDIIEDIRRRNSDKQRNFADSEWLWDYARNIQPILKREDTTNGASSNNTIVVNYAIAISRNLSAYTFPKGINYLSRKQEDKYNDFVDYLNRMMAMKSNNVAVQEMKWYQSVCGHAFLYVNYDPEQTHNIPFTVQCVAPWNAYVVYSAFDIYKPIYGVIEYENIIHIFTSSHAWAYDMSKSQFLTDADDTHVLGCVPIIEVPNNTMRLGDFEIAVTLLDGINTVASDSVNNVQDVVKSYLFLLGVDPDEASKLDFSQGSVLALSGQPGINQNATFIHPALDGTTVQQLRSYMEQALKFVVGIPDRDTDNAASSTGASEDIKTGQADKDAIANEKSMYVEEAQRRVLEIVLKILSIKTPEVVPSGITAADIDIDITRANRDNILTKSQALLNLKQFGLCDEDSLYFANLTNDAPGVARRMIDTSEGAESEDEFNLIDDEQDAAITA